MKPKPAARSKPGIATTPTPPARSAAELDAVLQVLEARAPGLRRAGALRLKLGDLDVRLAGESAAASTPKPKPDESTGDDELPDMLAAYRGRGRAAAASAAKTGGES